MKKLLICLAFLALIVSVGVMRAEAATDTITVTVTLQNVSVSITAGDPWALGTMVAGATSSAQACTATNDGNVSENFTIKVGNSSPTVWTPGTIAGAGVFVMELNATAPPTYLDGIDKSLASGIAGGGANNFTLKFTAPSSSTSYAQQTITVTVSATAA